MRHPFVVFTRLFPLLLVATAAALVANLVLQEPVTEEAGGGEKGAGNGGSGEADPEPDDGVFEERDREPAD